MVRRPCQWASGLRPSGSQTNGERAYALPTVPEDVRAHPPERWVKASPDWRGLLSVNREPWRTIITNSNSDIITIALDKLDRDPKNVRKTYRKDGIEELAESVPRGVPPKISVALDRPHAH